MSGDHNLSYGVCALGYALFRSLAALPRQTKYTRWNPEYNEVDFKTINHLIHHLINHIVNYLIILINCLIHLINYLI